MWEEAVWDSVKLPTLEMNSSTPDRSDANYRVRTWNRVATDPLELNGVRIYIET